MSGLNGWFVETIRLLFRFSSRLCPARHDLQSRTALFKRRRTDFLDALSVTTPVCGVATPPDQGPELKRRSKFDACFFLPLFFLYDRSIFRSGCSRRQPDSGQVRRIIRASRPQCPLSLPPPHSSHPHSRTFSAFFGR